MNLTQVVFYNNQISQYLKQLLKTYLKECDQELTETLCNIILQCFCGRQILFDETMIIVSI